MAPTTVRMVLVEGDKADGVTVDHDTFDIATGGDPATTSAADQVVAAILGTRESAAEGGHHLISTGVTWTDRGAAAELRDALTAHNIEDVILVSELHAAGSLAQAVGGAVGYERTALLFLERDTATLSVVQTADGAVVRVQSRDLHAPDAAAELAAMVAGLEGLDEPPQGLFVLGAGVDVAALQPQIAAATSLPVHAPDDAELALARGAALASAAVPRYEASTVGLAYAQDRDGTTAGAAVYAAGADTEMSAGATQLAAAGYMAPLGYSAVDDDEDPGYPEVPIEFDDRLEAEESDRKPFLLVGSALTSIFVVGVVALVISLAVSIRPTVDQRPSPGQSAIVPSSQAPAPAAQVPAPPSAADTIQEPVPVVQQAPRTVFVAPAPRAPAPAPAAPAPAPAAPAPAPAAPAPVPAPEAPAPAPAPAAPIPIPLPIPIPVPVFSPPVFSPPVIQLPRPVPPVIRPPSQYPSSPPSSVPSYPSSPPASVPSYPSSPSASVPQSPSNPPSSYPSYPSAPQTTQAPSYPSPAAGSGGSGGGYGSGESGSGASQGSGGSTSSGGSTGSGGSGSSGGSSSTGGSGGGSQSPVLTVVPGIGG